MAEGFLSTIILNGFKIIIALTLGKQLWPVIPNKSNGPCVKEI